MENCVACRNGWHAECVTPRAEYDEKDVVQSWFCCCWSNGISEVSEVATVVTRDEDSLVVDTRKAPRVKDDSKIRDQTSTGRKRAAALYPIPPEGMLCEWAGKAYAGGGVIPIVGCRSNMIVPIKRQADCPEGTLPGAIHHGPDKSTLNNEPTNVSRICAWCHNRWHALNDPYYPKVRPDEGAEFVPLSGIIHPLIDDRPATEDDFLGSELYWSLTDKQRATVGYRIWSNDE